LVNHGLASASFGVERAVWVRYQTVTNSSEQKISYRSDFERFFDGDQT